MKTKQKYMKADEFRKTTNIPYPKKFWSSDFLLKLVLKFRIKVFP